ncbi:MAG: hypothetical protein ACI936_002208 [Paraglaciecola sp.]|jgi:hypothetical protein
MRSKSGLCDDVRNTVDKWENSRVLVTDMLKITSISISSEITNDANFHCKYY